MFKILLYFLIFVLSFLIVCFLTSVCLSTLDRRSRDRFIESSDQIAALVDKFKIEGHEYRKFTPFNESNNHQQSISTATPSIPLTAYGKASSLTVTMALIQRRFSSNFTFVNLFRNILTLPLFFTLFYLFLFPKLANNQSSFQTRSSLLLNCLVAINFITPAITSYTFSSHRNRFYEESSRLSLYRGPLFIFTQIITSLPFNLFTIWISASLIYWLTGLRADNWWLERWTIFCANLWVIHTFAGKLIINFFYSKKNFNFKIYRTTYNRHSLLHQVSIHCFINKHIIA